ncbi:hypothetical protein V1521DRAFT_347318, partial [Lipomyces starkeyi]
SKPMPPKSWVWEHFHSTELETTYIHKGSKKSHPDRLIMCTRCSWTTTDAVLQWSSGNLGRHLGSQHKIFKPGTSIPLCTPRISSDITSFLIKPVHSVEERLEENILRWIVQESEPFMAVESQSFQRIFRDLPDIALPLKSASTVKCRLVAVAQLAYRL